MKTARKVRARKKQHGSEPLPGYRLLEPLGRGSAEEVWKCEAPGGGLKTIKFIEARAAQDPLASDFQAIQRAKAARHPFLLSLERAEVVDGELVLVTELVERSLADRFAECLASGQPGVGRDELLAFLTEAAEALDVMNIKHGLQHLDIKPANLFIVGNHLKVADFGLAYQIADLDGGKLPKKLHGLTPLYVAPELLRGKISRHSDQYSLAAVYKHLLTGTQLFTAETTRKTLLAHLMNEPDLSALPSADRSVVARALAKDPEQRYLSCLHFVQALVFGEGAELDSSPDVRETPRTQQTPTVTRMPQKRRAPATQSNGPQPAQDATHGEPKSPATTNQLESTQGPPPVAPTGLTLPGYKLLEMVSEDAHCQLYVALDPEGRKRQIRSLRSGPGAELDQHLLERLASLRHPALAPLTMHRLADRGVALISDAVERTLQDRFNECVAARNRGIPRPELLGMLETAAEVVDVVRVRNHLQHLSLSPRSVLLKDGKVMVGDFGLAQLTWLHRWRKVPHANPHYAAPELLHGHQNPACDTYSLALIYTEMITGIHPFHHRARVRQSSTGEPVSPDLDKLTGEERAVVARALHVDPRMRFQSCGELVEALAVAASAQEAHDHLRAEDLPSIRPLAEMLGGTRSSDAAPSINCIVTHLVLAELSADSLGVADTLPYLQRTNRLLEARFPIRLLPGLLRLKMDAFCTKWGARLVKQADHDFVVRLQESSNLWHRLIGQKSGLEVSLQLYPARPANSHTCEATAVVRPFGNGQQKAIRKLQEVGPLLLIDLRDQLQNTPDQRGQVRWPCAADVEIYPLNQFGEACKVVEAKCMDISFGGIGVWMAQRPTCEYAYLRITTFAELAPYVLLVRIVRAGPSDGGYKIGTAFVSSGAGCID